MKASNFQVFITFKFRLKQQKLIKCRLERTTGSVNNNETVLETSSRKQSRKDNTGLLIGFSQSHKKIIEQLFLTSVNTG